MSDIEKARRPVGRTRPAPLGAAAGTPGGVLRELAGRATHVGAGPHGGLDVRKTFHDGKWPPDREGPERKHDHGRRPVWPGWFRRSLGASRGAERLRRSCASGSGSAIRRRRIGWWPIALPQRVPRARPRAADGAHQGRGKSTTEARYRIELSQRPDGTDVAATVWRGERLAVSSRTGAEMAIARALCARGAPDGPWEALSPGGSLRRLYGASSHALARLTVTEGEQRPRVVPWVPHPRAAAAA